MHHDAPDLQNIFILYIFLYIFFQKKKEVGWQSEEYVSQSLFLVRSLWPEYTNEAKIPVNHKA